MCLGYNNNLVIIGRAWLFDSRDVQLCFESNKAYGSASTENGYREGSCMANIYAYNYKEFIEKESIYVFSLVLISGSLASYVRSQTIKQVGTMDERSRRVEVLLIYIYICFFRIIILQ